MKFKNKIKRIADILEKLGVAGIALGLFQEGKSEVTLAVIFILFSLILTQESEK